MATRIDLLDTYMDAAIAAQAAGDYGRALNNALAAQGVAASLPKASRSQGTGGGEQSASWDPQAIQNFVQNLYRMQGQFLGVQSAPIEISEPVTLDDGSQLANSQGGYVQ